ncbi:MAG: RrF2 family transcriptional regulator [Myxococcota bacterium]
MRFTAQEEYGLRCLLQIARSPEGFLTIKGIAEREALTPAYVAKLMRVLRRAGLVTSTRGKHGGYELAVSADQVTLGRVMTALGGSFSTYEFCRKHAGNKRTCVHELDCALRPVWMSIDHVVQKALEQTRLGDLVRPRGLS